MSAWTSKKDLIKGFEVCEQEITELRNDNKIMVAQLNIVDRMLNVIECHTPKPRIGCDSQDILWKIRQTKNALEEEIKNE